MKKCYMILTAAFSTIMLLIVIFAFNIIRSNIDHTKIVIKEIAVTEYVYITDAETEATESTNTEKLIDEIYTVKEHMGLIGVFGADGTLIRVIETNIKALPEADRRLLQEGFEVVGSQRLNSIIEDYTG